MTQIQSQDIADAQVTDAKVASGISASKLSGDITGKAATATKLATPVTINGTSFDGSANVTVSAAAGTLTGSTLASGVTASSLTSFGSSPTLTTPTIASLANATHSHQDSAGGGTISTDALASGQLKLARGGTNADLSATGSAGGCLMQPSSGANIAVKVRPMSVQLHGTSLGTAATTSVAPTSGAQELQNTTNHGAQSVVDLSGYTQYRLIARFSSTGVAGVKMMLRGSVGGSGVHNLEDTSDSSNAAACTFSSEAMVTGAWTALHATYQADGVLVTTYTISGNGSTQLSFRRIEAQFR
jgi:hypothetical protein